MRKTKHILVTGAGGFIGHHLVNRLKDEGYWVLGVDIKFPEYAPTRADEFIQLDLQFLENCLKATEKIDEVYTLAADMGGIGYITGNHAKIGRKNILINAHILEASRINSVSKLLFTSSACVYPQYKQETSVLSPLKEEDAYPADPERGYGWEKLYTEQLCTYYREDFEFDTRIVRLHNVYGPEGTYDGGREKVPAALCRKIALTPDNGEIEIWGDGEQTRSFLFISDCLEGLRRVMDCDDGNPFNIGSERLITINELALLISDIAGKRLNFQHKLDKPQGVRGRNSDNTRIRKILGWEPSIPLEIGLKETYVRIESELKKSGRI